LSQKRFLLILILASLTLSLTATLASYYYHYKDPRPILDASFAYRGWPVYWLVESISYWSPPPYHMTLEFKPANFIIDFIFYTIAFQLPSTILILVKETKRNSAIGLTHAKVGY